MNLKTIVLGATLLGACATTQPQIKKSDITDAFCGILRNHRLCIAQYPDMEAVYATNFDKEFPACSVYLDYEDGHSELLRDDECDEVVDSYLLVNSEDSKMFMTRSEFEDKFQKEFDPLFKKIKHEILDATK